MWHLITKSYIRGSMGQHNTELLLCRSNMHNALTRNSWISIFDCTIISQPEHTLTILVPVREKPTYSLVFPVWSALVSPVLTAWADPHLPPDSSSSSRHPTLLYLPSRALLSSDLERHHHLPKAAVLPEKVELSQSPCGVQPSVPLFLWFSHHWAKPHGSSTPAVA